MQQLTTVVHSVDDAELILLATWTAHTSATDDALKKWFLLLESRREVKNWRLTTKSNRLSARWPIEKTRYLVPHAIQALSGTVKKAIVESTDLLHDLNTNCDDADAAVHTHA